MMKKISTHQVKYEKTSTFRDFIQSFLKKHKEIELFVEKYGEYYIKKDVK